MLIAHLTDTHLRGKDKLIQTTIDPLPRLKAVLEHIRKCARQPDVVVVSGDLADRAEEEAYVEFAGLLEDFDVPCFVVPGNHDNRTQLREALPDCIPADGGFLHYVVDRFDVRLIGLDTMLLGSDCGELCADRLDWLNTKLEEATSKPTLIFMHHPPFMTFIDEMDGYGLDGSEAFAEVIARHSQVKLIICGHVHRSISAMIAHAPVIMGPAVAFDQVVGIGPDGECGLHPQSGPKYALHLWTGAGFVSHVITHDDSGRSVPYLE